MKIGNIEIKNKVVLAPMAGVSNYPFMKICEDMGVGYAVTELISAEAIVRGNKKTFQMLEGYDKLNIPVAVQLFGSNPEVMAKASQIVAETSLFKIIDINMGCPVPKVALGAQAGSSLLKNPDKIKKIVSTVVNSVSIPVTVKIRSGWDQNSINAKTVAKVIEEAGASAITIHPRTRKQGYAGLSNWEIIKQVKNAVSIPVIGNGDIKSCYDAKRMLDETGCDAVMIGRATLGNPWLIKECVEYLKNGTLPTYINIKEKIDMIKYHFELLCKTKSEKIAILEIRSHIAWYLKGLPNSKEFKELIFKTKTKDEIINLLNKYEIESI